MMFPLAALLGVGENQILDMDSGVFYKDCEFCGKSKQSREFRLRTESKVHSRRPFCFSCEKVKSNKNYEKNKTVRLKNVEKYRKENWEMKMLWQAKATANRKNIPFDIEVEDIKIPTHCKYLGTPLTFSLGEGVVWSNPSLDRIDSSKGYVKGNVEVISRKANSMKNMADVDELRTFARNVLRIYGE